MAPVDELCENNLYRISKLELTGNSTQSDIDSKALLLYSFLWHPFDPLKFRTHPNEQQILPNQEHATA